MRPNCGRSAGSGCCAPFGATWDFVRCDQRTPFTLHVASDSDREYTPPPPGEPPRALLLVTSPTDLADYGLGAFDTLATLYGLRTAVAPWPVDVLAFGVPEAVGAPTLEGLCTQLDRDPLRGGPHRLSRRGDGEPPLLLPRLPLSLTRTFPTPGGAWTAASGSFSVHGPSRVGAPTASAPRAGTRRRGAVMA